MNVLIADAPDDVQDPIQVGLEAFGDVTVECARGVLALDRVRRCNYDGILLGLGGDRDERLLDCVLEDHADLPVVILGKTAELEKFKQHPHKSRAWATVKLPVQPVEFFRTMQRVRQRLGVHAS